MRKLVRQVTFPDTCSEGIGAEQIGRKIKHEFREYPERARRGGLRDVSGAGYRRCAAGEFKSFKTG